MPTGEKIIGIERLHLEQDAGKSIHDIDPIIFEDRVELMVSLLALQYRLCFFPPKYEEHDPWQ